MNKRIMIWIVAMVLLALPALGLSLNEGLVAGWNMDNNTDSSLNLYDVTGNGNIGIKPGVNRPLKTATAILGNATDYSGANNDDYVDIPNNFGLFDGSKDFSLQVWFRRDGGDNHLLHFLGENRFQIRSYDKTIQPNRGLSVHYNDGAWTTLESTNTSNDKWIHGVVTYNSVSGFVIYVNNTAYPHSDTPSISSETGDNYIGMDSNGNDENWDGQIDEVFIWNRTLTNSEVTKLWNNGAGLKYSDFGNGNSVTVDINSPPNKSSFAETNFTVSFNYSESSSNPGNCTLYIDGTANSTINNIPSGTNNTLINATNLVDGTYNWIVGCLSSNVSETNTSQRVVYIDTVQPQIINHNPTFTNGSKHWRNITINFTINDTNNYETIINITSANGTAIFSKSYNTSGTTLYNITNTINHTFSSWYTMFLETWDGHTAVKIPDIPHTTINKELNFEEKGESVRIYPALKTLFSKVEAEKVLEDRYNFQFTRNTKALRKNNYDEFIVEGGYYIDIIHNSEYPGHVIVKRGSSVRDWYWVDFNTKENYKVDVFRVTDRKVRVRVYGEAGKDYTFHSLGKLNVNNITIQYYFNARNINLTETYTQNIISGFQTTFTMSAVYNNIRYNTSLMTPTAYLTWNGTNYTGTLVSSNTTHTTFNRALTPTSVSAVLTIPHNWTFQIRNQTNNTINTTTPSQNQTLYNIVLAPCNATINQTVVNYTYWNEYDYSSINATNDYTLTFFDGTYNISVNGQFAGNHMDSICTNLPYPTINYSWLVYGTYTVSHSSYLTRVYTFTQATGHTIGNYFNTTIPFYLINSGNSSTVTYTWQTTSYQPINGLLEIRKCNPNGTQTLVDSVGIITGTAVANIELLFQQYSYTVYIDGVAYTDSNFNTCHVESVTNPIYYVDVTGIDITPAIGLLLVDCTITQDGGNVTMSFSDIGGSSDLEGYLEIKRKDIYGYTLVTTLNENLSGTGSQTINYTFLSDANTYHAEGYIHQGDDIGYCTGSASYPLTQSTTEQTFGVSGIFAIVILILALTLIYSGDGDKMLVAGIAGLIFSWVLGIFSMPWEVVSLLVFFLGFIAWIGRYSRK